MNRLAHEKSPYLLQHKANPVDWFPWGDEAFEKARKEDKPVFLSVGYSTCHWCHVMEHESFENEKTAAILNRHFVSIKVDREERPDIDRTYMSYVQAATGSGGWPMSVWLTPEGLPFVGGTYFPPDDRFGRPGFPVLLERIARAWDTERDRIVEASRRILAELEQEATLPSGDENLGPEILDSGFAICRRLYDRTLGGFGSAPKFPRPVIFDFLLRYHARTGNSEALEMTVDTLRAMSRGGMNDQLGGGFHRYSVDEYWFVPHFEKMLYDQAQIASSLVEAFQITGDPIFAEQTRRVLDYVLRDLTSPEGAFFSAEDADSVIDPAESTKKGEGAFYIWSASEIAELLGAAAARLFSFRYGVEPHGNVTNDPHLEFVGKNILFSAHTVEETAHHFDLPLDEAQASLRQSENILFQTRCRRIRPHLDDKVLTGWNGLMIGAFAKAGAVLAEPRYIQAARRAADFIRARMWDRAAQTLYRRYREGEAAIPGFLDDYAFFIKGLIDLYEADFQEPDLRFALDLTARMLALFEDSERGGFFSTARSSADSRPLVNAKDDYDGAEPAGNSIAALDLLRLARIAGRPDLEGGAKRTLGVFAARLREQPFALPEMLCALACVLSPPAQIVIVGEKNTPATTELLAEIRKKFLPFTAVLLVGERPPEFLTAARESIGLMQPPTGQSAAFVCENFTCRLPVTEPRKLAELLQ